MRSAENPPLFLQGHVTLRSVRFPPYIRLQIEPCFPCPVQDSLIGITAAYPQSVATQSMKETQKRVSDSTETRSTRCKPARCN